MASKLIQPPPIQPSHLHPHQSKLANPNSPLTTILTPVHRPNYTRVKLIISSSEFTPFKLAASSEEHSSGLLEDDGVNDCIDLIKASIYQALEGINRGVFGVTSVKKREIEELVIKLESLNPTSNPTLNLDKVSGSWKLIYSTITILGSKRTKLGLRDFISLGDFLQNIDIDEGKATNIIEFSARGFSSLSGRLTIQASFSVASSSRVNIKYENSKITPDQLMNLFKKNYDLLLSIFNPEGWLDITYVDEGMRIGRDDKGNIFILGRATDSDRV